MKNNNELHFESIFYDRLYSVQTLCRYLVWNLCGLYDGMYRVMRNVI